MLATSGPRGGREEDGLDLRQPEIGISRKVTGALASLRAELLLSLAASARHAQPVDTSMSNVGFEAVHAGSSDRLRQPSVASCKEFPPATIRRIIARQRPEGDEQSAQGGGQ